MKVGDLFRNIHTGELWVITATAHGNYVEVCSQWLVPSEHLELISENR